MTGLQANRQYPFLGGSASDEYFEPGESWLDWVLVGWRPAFLEMCKEILDLFSSKGYDISGLHIDQVKEKFGELRVYFSLTDDCSDLMDSVQEIIDRTCDKTSSMCWVCGQPASRVSRGYTLPYCDACARRAYEEQRRLGREGKSFEDCFPKRQICAKKIFEV